MVPNIKKSIFTLFVFLVISFGLFINDANAAVLSANPTSGTFSVGSTFDVSIFLDTEGESINAIDARLDFPPDKLQLASPSTGSSIIGVWTAQPEFNNRTGSIRLQGGIPSGINVSQGLVTTLTFRVRKTGSAVVRFKDESQVLLNDGKGTQVLSTTNNGIYSLILPPPSGPTVVSETHPDQTRWFPNPNVSLKWGGDSEVEGYSYTLSKNPVENPDNISEGTETEVVYEGLESGTHYFHIKAMRDGMWGGVTHHAINIDVSPPAEFPVNIEPDAQTTSKNPILSFSATDQHSGLDFYEYKIVYLDPDDEPEFQNQNFFVEFSGQQILSLEKGSYSVIARAYDKAGNIREVTQELEVMNSVDWFIAKYKPFLLLLALITLILIFIAFRTHKWHFEIEHKHIKGYIPEIIKDKIKKLRDLRDKYNDDESDD